MRNLCRLVCRVAPAATFRKHGERMNHKTATDIRIGR